MNELIPIERIEGKIYLIRGKKVMLDRDLAGLYKVQTRDLNKAVSRNLDRFPEDFMFQLTQDEFENLKFKFGTSSLAAGKEGWGGTRKLPKVFTEQGVAMLSSVLRSKRAIHINILIMRAFVKLRQLLSSHKELARKIEELENKYSKHEIEISAVFKLLKKLMEPPPEAPRKRIGFVSDRG